MIIIFPIDLWFRPKCKIKTSRYNNLTIEHLKLKSGILFAQETRDSTNLMVTFFLTSHNAIFYMRDLYLNIYRKLSIFICFLELVILRQKKSSNFLGKQDAGFEFQILWVLLMLRDQNIHIQNKKQYFPHNNLLHPIDILHYCYRHRKTHHQWIQGLQCILIDHNVFFFCKLFHKY